MTRNKSWVLGVFLLLYLGIGNPLLLRANPFINHPAHTPSPAPAPYLGRGPTHPYLLERQNFFREQMGNLFAAVDENPSTLRIWGIFGFAFLYGLFHSLGPGHRKGVLFSLYLAKKAPRWEPAAMGLLLALIHGSTSIVILFLLTGISGSISGITSILTYYFELVTFSILILVSIWLMIHSVKELLDHRHSHPEESLSKRALIASGFYPCPGTILILVLSLTLGQILLGVLTVIFMSLGMSIPIIGFAYIGWFGREGLLLKLQHREESFGRVSALLQLVGSCILFLFTLYISFPFFVVLI